PTARLSTLSLHDALPICGLRDHARDAVRLRGSDYPFPWRFSCRGDQRGRRALAKTQARAALPKGFSVHAGRTCWSKFALEIATRSEEHTSELQSRVDLVC